MTVVGSSYPLLPEQHAAKSLERLISRFFSQPVGQRILTPFSDFVRVIHPKSAAIIPWYLSGGISAANCIAAYQPKGAASLAASYTNLANPGTYNAAPGTAPTWNASTGWTFASASSQYLTTGVVTADNQTWSAIIQFSGATFGTKVILGKQFDGANNNAFVIYPYRAGGQIYYRTGQASTQTAVSPQLEAGSLAIAGRQGYRNGAADGGVIPAGSGTGASGGLFIGAMNYNGSPTQYIDATIVALAIYNTTITAPQVAALYTAMAAL